MRQLAAPAENHEGVQFASPFSTLSSVRCPTATAGAVAKVLVEFADAYKISRDFEFNEIVIDVWCRTGGHLAMVSFLGNQLQQFLEALRLANGAAPSTLLSLEWRRWVQCRAQQALKDHPTAILLRHRLHQPTAGPARALLQRILQGPAEGKAYRDSEELRRLEAEGFVCVRGSPSLSDGRDVTPEATNDKVRTTSDDTRGDGSSSPLGDNVLPAGLHASLFVIPPPALLRRLFYTHLCDLAQSVPVVFKLTLQPHPSGPNHGLVVDLHKTIYDAASLLDRSSLWHETSLCGDGTPHEFAFHFLLHAVLQGATVDNGWVLTAEARGAYEGRSHRIDLCFQSNGHRCGIEIMRYGRSAAFKQHCAQVSYYCNELKMANAVLLCVHTRLLAADERLDAEFFPTASEVDPRATVLHLCLPKTGPCTVMRSPKLEEDLVISRDDLSLAAVAQTAQGLGSMSSMVAALPDRRQQAMDFLDRKQLEAIGSFDVWKRVCVLADFLQRQTPGLTPAILQWERDADGTIERWLPMLERLCGLNTPPIPSKT